MTEAMSIVVTHDRQPVAIMKDLQLHRESLDSLAAPRVNAPDVGFAWGHPY